MEKKIDDIFIDGLSEPEIEFQEADWLAMEVVLKKNEGLKIRTIISWISGFAAILLIALLLAKPGEQKITSENKTKKPTQSTIVQNKNQAVVDHKALDKTTSNNTAETQKKQGYTTLKPGKTNASNKGEANIFANTTKNESALILSTIDEVGTLDKSDTDTQKLVSLTPDTVNQHMVLSNKPVEKGDSVTLEAKNLSEAPLADLKVKPTKVKPDLKSAFIKSLAITVLASTDLNSVHSLTNTKPGTNAGIMATWQVSPKVSFSSGLVYAKKIYSSPYSKYKPATTYSFSYSPQNIEADCRVLDIPLNVNYRVWYNKKNAMMFTGGVSSYIMLKENYEFQFSNYSTTQSYRNENQHILGVLNFAMAYERAIGSRTSIGLQPYFKLPITGIGQGNVKLLSAGVTLNMNLNLKKKP